MLKLSVIIPVYNVEEYLEKCVDSVLGPGVMSLEKGEKPSYEIIIVDDGSPDSSPEIADRYALNYPDFVRVMWVLMHQMQNICIFLTAMIISLKAVCKQYWIVWTLDMIYVFLILLPLMWMVKK